MQEKGYDGELVGGGVDGHWWKRLWRSSLREKVTGGSERQYWLA